MCIWYRGWQFEDCKCIIWDKSWSCGFRCHVPRRKLLRNFLGVCPNCSTMSIVPRDPNMHPSDNSEIKTNPENKVPARNPIHYPDNVPCDAHYDPSDVFDEALEEHMRHHPWNIMLSNSHAAAVAGGHGGEAGAWGPSLWGPSLNYDTLLKRYTEKQKQWPPNPSPNPNEQSKVENPQAKGQQGQTPRPPMETGGNLGRDVQSQPQWTHPLFIHPKPSDLGRVAQSQPQSKQHPRFIHPKPSNLAAWDGGYESDEDPVPTEYRYKSGI